MCGFCAILDPNEMGVTCSNKSTMFLQKKLPFLSSMSEPNYVSYPLCHETLWKIIKFRQSSFDSSSKKEIIYPFRFADSDKHHGHSITTGTRWGGRGSKMVLVAQGITTVHAGDWVQKMAKFCARSCWMPLCLSIS